MEGGKDIVSALWNPSCFSLAPKELGCGNRQVMGPKRRGGDLLWKELIKLWALSSLSLSLSPSLSLSLMHTHTLKTLSNTHTHTTHSGDHLMFPLFCFPFFCLWMHTTPSAHDCFPLCLQLEFNQSALLLPNGGCWGFVHSENGN